MTEVLDHGEVTLLSKMGGDLDVVGAARVSKGTRPEDASKGEKADGALIRFLMSNGHGTPFEQAVFKFYVKAPIFVFREWQRHRIGSYNEQSGRYSEFVPEFYVPDHVRAQDPVNKQSSVRVDDERLLTGVRVRIEASYARDYEAYKNLLDRGVAREMARLVLPVSLYSSMWWTVNARALMNFLMLRNADAAQWEIRQYAIAIEDIFAGAMPVTHQAFNDSGRRAP